MKKGRVVQFGDGTYGYQRMLFGIIPVYAFLEPWRDGKEYWRNGLRVECKHDSLESLKQMLKFVENYENPAKIVRVVKETELTKALE